jgi:integrase
MIYKSGRHYMAKFMWQGKMIRKSTRCANAKDARVVEGKIRAELGKGNFGILKAKPRMTLAEFLKHDFLPFVETEFKAKANTKSYYDCGVRNLRASDLGGLRLDEITSQHVNGYIAKHGHLEETTINRDLRTLRRSLNLAVEWGKLDRMPKVTLAKGENRRERILTEEEAKRYLAACPQPWHDVATVLLGTGMRPGEAYKLCWQDIHLNGTGGYIHISDGKTRAARRLLPMVPAVYAALKARHEAQGKPFDSWVFPTGSRSGHIEESSAKQWHGRALATLEKAHEDNPEQFSEVKPFEPYCLRHTALTWLAKAGCDAFTLARIAGHSNITITQRYVHPETEAVEAAFQKLVTYGGQQEKSLILDTGTNGDVSIAVSNG